ncbi:MAG TPA: hypothetical protein PK728_04615 [Bacillota bacterium]|nr:hypothetical protein [Bacillota bacterium]
MSTPVLLVDGLRDFIEPLVKSYVLETNRPNLAKPPQVVTGYLPPKNPNFDAPDFPFVIVRFVEGTDSDDGSTAVVKIIAGTYSEDAREGWRDAANILQRVKTELLKRRVIAKKYRVELPMKIEMPEEQPFPEWIGVMTTTWAVAQPLEEVIYEQE